MIPSTYDPVVKYHKADGTETLKTAYTYDVNDQVTLMEGYEKKNGSWELYRSTKYTYDALKRMSSYTEWDGEGAAPAEPTVSYTYDIEGNVTAVDCAGTGSELTGLTFEYDNSRIRNGKNAYTYTRTLAKKAMITAGKGWRKSEIDKKNERNIGKPLYYHYHPKVKNGAHMWYGMPKVYEK